MTRIYAKNLFSIKNIVFVKSPSQAVRILPLSNYIDTSAHLEFGIVRILDHVLSGSYRIRIVSIQDRFDSESCTFGQLSGYRSFPTKKVQHSPNVDSKTGSCSAALTN